MGCANSKEAGAKPSKESGGLDASTSQQQRQKEDHTGSSSSSSRAGGGLSTAQGSSMLPSPRDSALEDSKVGQKGGNGSASAAARAERPPKPPSRSFETSCMDSRDSIGFEGAMETNVSLGFRNSSGDRRSGGNTTSFQAGQLLNSNKRSGEYEHSSVVSASPGMRSSQRSSFAVDAGSGSANGALGPMAGRNKQTAEKLQGQKATAGTPGMTVPSALERFLMVLAIVPADTPVPTSMLQNLWATQSLEATLSTVQALETYGVLRVAQLDDGSTWCLVASATLAYLQNKYGVKMAMMHSALLDAYSRDGGGSSHSLAARDIPDDGYIMQNMAHHLVGCGRVGTLRALLGEPAWLEAKLHAYGTAPVVADFRRYLAEVPEDSSVRLLLQALQLSLGCCAEQPGVHMLREQMLARLMNAAHEQQQQPHKEEGGSGYSSASQQAAIMDGTLACKSSKGSKNLEGIMSGAAAASGSHGASVQGAQGGTGCRDSARYSGLERSLREWFESQSSHAVMDICTAAGHGVVHLLPRSATLKQAGGVQRMILRGHAGPIHKVVISPNGQDVVTVSEDGSAQVWDMNVGDCVMQLARQQALSDVDVAPDGCLCVVASVDGAACVWDLATGAVKHVLRGHTSKINSVAIDRAGLRCVTASDDRSVRVWSIEKGKCEAVLAGHGHGKTGCSGEFGLVFDVSLSSDGSMAATASEDFTARVWDLDQAKCEHVLEGHSGWVAAVKFIGDTTRVITASHDATARVWDGIRGLCLHTLVGHTGRLNSVAVDSAGTLAVTCSDDGSARVWDLETGTCRCVLQRHDAWVADAAIARDGARCVTVGGDGLVCVWDCRTGELQAALEGHSAALRSVVLTGGGRFAVTAGDDGTARVWDLGAKSISAQEQQGHSSRVISVLPLVGGRQVVSASEGGDVIVWDVGSCTPAHRLLAHTSAVGFLAVTSDGKRALSGTSNRHVCCWDLVTGKLLASLPPQQGSRVKAMGFSKDGSHVAVVLFDSSTAVLDINTGKAVAQLIGRGERIGRNVHVGGVNGVLLCGGASGADTAVTWSKDCTARVWDVATATVRVVCEGHTDGLRCAAISADETMLATGSYGACVRLHSLEDGTPVAVLDHAAPAVAVEFSRDGSLLAVTLENHTVVIWDLVEHSCLPPLLAHKSDITSLSFSPDSTMIVTCSQDCTTRVWDAHTGRQIAFFVADAGLTSCCCAGGVGAAACDILVVADAGGSTHFLDCPYELQPEGNLPY